MEHVTFVALLCCCLLITTGTDPMCLDLNNNCNYWASAGECDNRHDYVHVNCPWSCDKCGDRMCQNHHTYCNYWASVGECDKTPRYMHVNCTWSCDKCGDGPDAGNVEIENCNARFIDTEENANNTITCKGFNVRSFIVWTFKRDGEDIPKEVATCYASSNCTVHQPDHFAVERSESESTLFYQQHDREVDKAGIVACRSQFGVSQCNVNVINPAELSSCTVEEDRDSGTVRGRCRFQHAYSYWRGFSCTWYQETDGQYRHFLGTISFTSSSEDDSGWCNFTRTDMTWEPGTYTYSINFYPGPGEISVNVVNMRTDTNTPKPTRGTPETSSSDVFLQTTKGNVDYTSPRTQEENDLSFGAIVGAIMAVVAVIIIVVVVVVVVFIMRKRKQKPAGSAYWSSNDASNENDDFEEHINSMYVTSDDPDDTHSTDHKPSVIALRISPNSHTGHPAAPHSLQADMYTTVDGEARVVPCNQASDMRDRSAVVNKSSSRNKAAKNVASGLSDASTNNAGADVYAQVNKSAKKVKVAVTETEGATYAQVQKPKPATKPETSAKPSSEKDVAQRDTADDDEYHTLRHTRGSPHTQDQADLESQYSHIGHN